MSEKAIEVKRLKIPPEIQQRITEGLEYGTAAAGIKREPRMNHPLIGLTGYAGSGKDTAAKSLIEMGWTRVSFADPVRECLLALDPIMALSYIPQESPKEIAVGMVRSVTTVAARRLASAVAEDDWNFVKGYPEVRRLLQRMGTEVGRNILGENIWVDIAERKIEAIAGPVVVTDVRFPNEAEMIRRRGGSIVRIERPGLERVNEHSSETEIDKIEPDITLMNLGPASAIQSDLRELALRHRR